MKSPTMAKKQWSKSVAEQWGLFLPPARPSLSELAVFENHLLELKKNKNDLVVGILGSTPEYRDLCQTYDVAYKCIEYNPANFTSLSGFMLHKDTSSHVIESDWRTMEFKQTFDVFMGDLVTTVVPVAYHQVVFKNIRAHCNPSATVMLKVPLRQNDARMTHAEIFDLYRRELSHLNPFAAVWHEVLLSDYDFAEDTMHCQISLQSLKESFNAKVITAFEFGEFKKRWDALGDFRMNIPRETDYLRKVGSFFNLVEKTSGSDWYREWAPILVLRPKI